MPAQLSLTLGAAPTFGTFTPGVDREYTAQTTATVIATSGDSALSVSPVSPGGLATASLAGHVDDTFRQHISANDALRSGSYSRMLTFTLSTTSP